MKRRDFLKLTAFAGLSVVSPLGWRRRGYADELDSPLWVMVNASGGWDPTSFCDPKGRENEEQEDALNNYFAGDIQTAGNIRYAPVANNEFFFEKYYRQLLVINGIDTETNGHDSGNRHTWSGRLAEGHPSFSALVAASIAPEKPMAFVSNGGYDYTAGLVGATRVGDPNRLLSLAWPNRSDPANEESNYHTEATWERINRAQQERLEDLRQNHHHPHIENTMGLLYTARAGDNELRRLSDFLPEIDNSSALRRQAQIAIAAYRAGICVSANLSMGGFDTHGNHDANHFARLEELFDGVDFLMEEAERQGVADKVVVAMGSDFGRTPGYNENNGKDHWSITSMMFMGAGIPGNAVIGSTDAGHRPHLVNPSTGEVDSGGIRIKPEHVHRAMRRLAGIDESEMAVQFGIGGEDIPLFG